MTKALRWLAHSPSPFNDLLLCLDWPNQSRQCLHCGDGEWPCKPACLCFLLISNWRNRDIGSGTRRSLQFDYLHIFCSICTLVSFTWLTPSPIRPLTPATRQLPSNLVLRKVGVRNWLPFMAIAWGAVQLGMGFVNVWPWLVFCRVLLGAFEVRQLFHFLSQQPDSPA